MRPEFEARTACTIVGTFGAVGAMRARLLVGEPADLVILSRGLIDGLARDGYVAADSIRDVGAVETAVAVRRVDAPPPIGDAARLRAALVAADEIHFPDPEQATAGIHFAKVLRQLGLSEMLADRLRPAANGAAAMRALAASQGRHPIGCTQATEIMATPGLVLVAALPPGCDLATVYSCAVTARSEAAPEAAELIAMLTGDAGRDTRRRLGFV